ncbi:MAG TPA: GNAT family N-acetyltransferase [Acidimicrobiales bacterium]|nr:GNAT family N-acetyltransferase [Acidimicrobiales bacterium]
MDADPAVVIRPYEPADRAAVRHICHVTGYMGEPVDWLWRDTESFADLFTSYYTDAEPRSAWVAELDGRPAGYLLGCVDSRAAWSPARIFARHVVRRGIALRPGTAGVVWRSFADIARDALHRRLPPAVVYDPRWPAHLHIDLLPAIRGRGVGAALVRRFLGTLRRAGVPGCHLETLGENGAAIAFFETMGFQRHGGRAPAPGLRSPAGQRHTIQLMVDTWGASPAGRGR